MTQLPADPLLCRRFRLLRELGRGAASVVLEARDRLQERTVALKLAARPGLVGRYRTEYRRLCEFRHPNIVRALDFGLTSDSRPFYTLELAHGLALGAGGTRPDMETLATVVMQTLDALACLHARGWVHRDLKPRNLMLVGTGPATVVRLLDFGLLARAGKTGRAAGTLPYMAPEVARGEVIDGRADLYSLGVVLYEALLPEAVARSVEEVSRWHTHSPLPPIRVDATVPAGLSDFVMRLIVPDPDARFSDAVKAAEALADWAGLPLSRGPERAASERMLRVGAVAHRPRLMKRLGRLAAIVREEAVGKVAVIEGAAGVGKTPVLRELSAVLNLEGMRVIRLRTTHRSGSPVGALLRLAQAVAPDLGAAAGSASSLFESRAHAGEVSAFAGQVGVAVAAALGAEPTALLLDDLHRAEPTTLAVLRSLADELAGQPLLLVCAADRRSEGEGLVEIMGSAAEVVRLKPLSTRQVEALVGHRLNGLRLPAPALARLVKDSQGMPALVERTLAQLLVDRTIERQGLGFTFVGGRYRPVSYADPDGIAARLSRVRSEHAPILAAAAILGGELDAASVATVAQVTVEEAAAALVELTRLELLHLRSAAAHPLYVFADRHLLAHLYQSLASGERRRLHDRAATTLAADERGGRRIEDRVEHLLKGSDDDRAIVAAVEAGDRAASVLAERRAIEYYARAYARLPNPSDPRAPGVALRLGHLFERTGELERASVWFQAAAGGAEMGVTIEATLGLGAVAYVRGFTDETERHAQKVLGALASRPEPRQAAVARRLLALVAAHRGDVRQAEELLLETAQTLEASGAIAEQIAVLLDLARLARDRGALVKAVTFARRARRHAREIGDTAALAEASTVLGRGFALAARFEAAKRALLYGLRVARASGDRLRQGLVLREIGNLRIREGDLLGAVEHYEKSLELVRACRARADESAALHNIGIVRTRLGDFRAALTALHAALEICASIGDVQGTAATTVELAHTYARLGDLTRAQALLHSARKAAMLTQDTVTLVEAETILGWVAVRGGEVSQGRRLLGEVDTLLTPIEDPATRALALVYATRCALELGDGPASLRLVEALALVVEAGSLGDVRAAVAGFRGQALALLGEQEQAIEQLSQAINAASMAGLRPLEIDLRAGLGQLLAGTVQGAEQLTRAMELCRGIVEELAPDQAATYLATRQAQALRRAFHHVHAELVGAGVG